VPARSKPKPPPIPESARTPTAGRMRLPAIYGTPAIDQVQTWTHIDKRLREATHYWISTVDLHGRPHATPVDGIVHGVATTLTEVDLALAERLAAASKRKDGYGPTPQMYQASAISVLRPAVAFAWTDLNKDPTRFTFDVDRP
jgi:hypothetical protein